MPFDFLIVGAGLFGSVFAERISRILKKNVIVIDKRAHIGGNCFSEIDEETGIEFHKYGTHIFHTSNEEVWDYVSNFTKFNNYKHKVFAYYKGTFLSLPVSLQTIDDFNKSFCEIDEITQFPMGKNLVRVGNFEDAAIKKFGYHIYNALIKNYSKKHWGLEPSLLPAYLIKRLPLRSNYSKLYFSNKYQGVPLNGYKEFFRNLLDSHRIKIELESDYFKVKSKIRPRFATIYTGPIDRYFSYSFGQLGWRSITLKKEIIDKSEFQPVSVVNYPEPSFTFTRIHEPKHLHKERKIFHSKTVIFREYPIKGDKEPFYPIRNHEDLSKFNKYKKLAQREKNVIFGGRLGLYAYLDMDKTIKLALDMFSHFFKTNGNLSLNNSYI